ncbi:MAG: hypothetical protein QOD30_144 [Actinomycetota bacterium]|nr:hypothetical protein [Actinomycetota bacterium]
MRWREATVDAPDGWSHHNVAVLDDGTIVGFHPKERALLFFDGELRLLRMVSCDAMEAHDIVADGASLWLADCGHKLSLDDRGKAFVDPPVEDAIGAVLHVDLDGRTLRRIERWHDGAFLPTGLALDDRGIWIADGYGSNRIDLVAADGEVLVTIDGFDCCHGVRVHDGLLYVAERGKGRIAVHERDGRFVRHLGVGSLLAPCALDFVDDRICVADLSGRVTVLDADGELVAHLGADAAVQQRKGWPNAIDDGRLVPPPFGNGAFTSPHGIVAVDGDLIVTEWVLGGHWIRTPLPT